MGHFWGVIIRSLPGLRGSSLVPKLQNIANVSEHRVSCFRPEVFIGCLREILRAEASIHIVVEHVLLRAFGRTKIVSRCTPPSSLERSLRRDRRRRRPVAPLQKLSATTCGSGSRTLGRWEVPARPRSSRRRKSVRSGGCPGGQLRGGCRSAAHLSLYECVLGSLAHRTSMLPAERSKRCKHRIKA